MKYLLSYFLFITICLVLSPSCNDDSDDIPVEPIPVLELNSAKVGTENLDGNTLVTISTVDQPLVLRFSAALNTGNLAEFIKIENEDNQVVDFAISFLDNDQTASLKTTNNLESNVTYRLSLLSEIKGKNGEMFSGADFSFRTLASPLLITTIDVDEKDLSQSGNVTDVARDLNLKIDFSLPVDIETLKDNITISGVPLQNLIYSEIGTDNKSFEITSNSTLDHLTPFTLNIKNGLTSIAGNPFNGFNRTFYTEIDPSLKFPEISDDELLTLIQEKTFKYFWDFAHPVSGLSRERNSSDKTVTSGGSGFGLMIILIGIERNFISRAEGIQRIETIVNFLENADRFHGVWSHWLDGGTGSVIPFSPNDDGGDLVETSYLVMGLLTVRQYLDDQNAQESTIIDKINELWNKVEWDWYRQGGQEDLTWHWSPNFGWEKNLKIRGYNEALITYILAASSTTHPIPASVYHKGWARDGGMLNGNEYYGINLPLGPNLGGPLFFEQYTFLGIDPRNLSDTYANYFTQGVNHTLINREHCIVNPNNHVGYSSQCWGLTASDGFSGYSAHSPTNDRGVITPTAAISSMPFTPEKSMDALKHFYYILGDKLWGEYGFYDAFSINDGWVANSFLAIDQGPIVIMIENHRSALLWDLFMSCPEVQTGLTALDFEY